MCTFKKEKGAFVSREESFSAWKNKSQVKFSLCTRKPVTIKNILINSLFYYDDLSMFILNSENFGLLQLLCLTMKQLELTVLASQSGMRITGYCAFSAAVTCGLHEYRFPNRY
jgi:hypothetical protein